MLGVYALSECSFRTEQKGACTLQGSRETVRDVWVEDSVPAWGSTQGWWFSQTGVVMSFSAMS